MIINTHLSVKKFRIPATLIVRPIYRITRTWDSQLHPSGWSSDLEVIDNYTTYQISSENGYVTQTTTKRMAQTLSYYQLLVDIGNNVEVGLMNYIKHDNKVVLTMSGTRSNTTGFYNSYYIDNGSPDAEYWVIAGSTETSVTNKELIINPNHFNLTTTAVDGTVLDGLIFYISTGDAPSYTTGVGGQQLQITWESASIDGIVLPVEIEDWPDTGDEQ